MLELESTKCYVSCHPLPLSIFFLVPAPKEKTSTILCKDFLLPYIHISFLNFQLQVRTVLDIGCGFGSFGAHLLSFKLMTVCIAAYEVTGSQVQLALERGLPAIIGNFISRQLPYPSLSFDMVHCAQCGIFRDKKGTVEVDFELKA